MAMEKFFAQLMSSFKQAPKNTFEMLTTSKEERQKKVACALNLFMVSISQIVDYNNETVLQQEYDAILNNLNLEQMPLDKEMLDLVLKTMDVCHFFVLHAKDKEMLKKKQQLRLKNCLANALGGGNIFAVISTPNPWAIAAGVAAMVGVAAVNYKSQRNKAELENEIEEWELEKSALEQLHNLRRSMFEAAWKLEEKYNYPDKYRLTEKQVGYYNKVLAIPDPVERYNKLDLLGKYFEAYPIFWYYLGRAAMESATLYCDFENIYHAPDNKSGSTYIKGYRYNCPEMYKYFIKKANNAFGEFENAHRDSMFLREDLIAATAYLDYAHILQLEKASAEDIKVKVDLAKECAGSSEDILQRCAFNYLNLAASLDGKAKEDCIEAAIECLRLLISQDCNVEMNSLALSCIYRGDLDNKIRKTDYLFLRDEAKRNCEFIRSRIAPLKKENSAQSDSCKKNDCIAQDSEWINYQDSKGLDRTIYRFLYGFFTLYLHKFFDTLAEVENTCDYEKLKSFTLTLDELKDKTNILNAFDEMFRSDDFVLIAEILYEEFFPRGSEAEENQKERHWKNATWLQRIHMVDKAAVTVANPYAALLGYCVKEWASKSKEKKEDCIDPIFMQIESMKDNATHKRWYWKNGVAIYDSSSFIQEKKDFDEIFQKSIEQLATTVSQKIKTYLEKPLYLEINQIYTMFINYDMACYEMRLQIRQSIPSYSHFNYPIPEELKDNSIKLMDCMKSFDETVKEIAKNNKMEIIDPLLEK